MRWAWAVLVVALLGSSSSMALPLHFDCFLLNVPGDCRELETALVSSIEFLERSPREDATIVVTVRGVNVDGGTRYVVTVTGPHPESASVTVYDRIPSALPPHALLVRLVGLMQKALAPALAVTHSAGTVDGILTLPLSNPAMANLATARPDASSLRWYLRPNASFDWAIDTTERLDLFAGGRANYSDPSWRFSLDTFAGYTSVRDPELLAEPFTAVFLGGVFIGVHSLGRGFSLKTSMLVAHDTNDNQLITTRPFVGLEWIRSPFLEANTSNFGVRYQFGGEHVLFLKENIRGRMQESFLLHDGSAFVSWHFDRVDLEASVAFRSILDDPRFSRVSSRGACIWRVTDELNIALRGTAEYRNALINAPAETSNDPLEQIFGGNFGAIATTVNLSVAYTFGNALLDRQDRRWRLD
jgi:hypothetical protein